MKKILWIILIVTCMTACSKKVPLDRKEFTSLLIDMHTVDGALTIWTEEYGGDDRKKYMYYNDLFEKYGITRAEFDSCVHYYSAKTALFTKIYDVVIDSLNRRLTEKTRVYKQLTLRDSMNLMPGYKMWVFDTLDCDSVWLKDEFIDVLCAGNWMKEVVTRDTVVLDEQNPYVEIELDGVVPGMYNFKTNLKFEHRDRKKSKKILAYFLSDQNDTLKIKDTWVTMDSIKRVYTWSYYVSDSIYNKLHIRILDGEKTKKGEKEWNGKIWDTGIFKLYQTPKEEERNKEFYRLNK